MLLPERTTLLGRLWARRMSLLVPLMTAAALALAVAVIERQASFRGEAPQIGLMAIDAGGAARPRAALPEGAPAVLAPGLPVMPVTAVAVEAPPADRATVTAVAPQPQAMPAAPVAPPAQAAAVQPSAAPVLEGPQFDDRPLRVARTMEMVVTGYSPDARSCGKWADGITASGYSVWTNAMKLVAADTRILPFNSVLTVPGYNDDRPVPVLDRGGAIKGNRLDLLFPTHEEALQWGRKTVTVTVWEYAD